MKFAKLCEAANFTLCLRYRPLLDGLGILCRDGQLSANNSAGEVIPLLQPKEIFVKTLRNLRPSSLKRCKTRRGCSVCSSRVRLEMRTSSRYKVTKLMCKKSRKKSQSSSARRSLHHRILYKAGPPILAIHQFLKRRFVNIFPPVHELAKTQTPNLNACKTLRP
jgi:hypothetical protein